MAHGTLDCLRIRWPDVIQLADTSSLPLLSRECQWAVSLWEPLDASVAAAPVHAHAHGMLQWLSDACVPLAQPAYIPVQLSGEDRDVCIYFQSSASTRHVVLRLELLLSGVSTAFTARMLHLHPNQAASGATVAVPVAQSDVAVFPDATIAVRCPMGRLGSLAQIEVVANLTLVWVHAGSPLAGIDSLPETALGEGMGVHPGSVHTGYSGISPLEAGSGSGFANESALVTCGGFGWGFGDASGVLTDAGAAPLDITALSVMISLCRGNGEVIAGPFLGGGAVLSTAGARGDVDWQAEWCGVSNFSMPHEDTTDCHFVVYLVVPKGHLRLSHPHAASSNDSDLLVGHAFFVPHRSITSSSGANTTAFIASPHTRAALATAAVDDSRGLQVRLSSVPGLCHVSAQLAIVPGSPPFLPLDAQTGLPLFQALPPLGVPTSDIATEACKTCLCPPAFIPEHLRLPCSSSSNALRMSEAVLSAQAAGLLPSSIRINVAYSTCVATSVPYTALASLHQSMAGRKLSGHALREVLRIVQGPDGPTPFDAIQHHTHVVPLIMKCYLSLITDGSGDFDGTLQVLPAADLVPFAFSRLPPFDVDASPKVGAQVGQIVLVLLRQLSHTMAALSDSIGYAAAEFIATNGQASPTAGLTGSLFGVEAGGVYTAGSCPPGPIASLLWLSENIVSQLQAPGQAAVTSATCMEWLDTWITSALMLCRHLASAKQLFGVRYDSTAVAALCDHAMTDERAVDEALRKNPVQFLVSSIHRLLAVVQQQPSLQESPKCIALGAHCLLLGIVAPEVFAKVYCVERPYSVRLQIANSLLDTSSVILKYRPAGSSRSMLADAQQQSGDWERKLHAPWSLHAALCGSFAMQSSSVCTSVFGDALSGAIASGNDSAMSAVGRCLQWLCISNSFIRDNVQVASVTLAATLEIVRKSLVNKRTDATVQLALQFIQAASYAGIRWGKCSTTKLLLVDVAVVFDHATAHLSTSNGGVHKHLHTCVSILAQLAKDLILSGALVFEGFSAADEKCLIARQTSIDTSTYARLLVCSSNAIRSFLLRIPKQTTSESLNGSPLSSMSEDEIANVTTSVLPLLHALIRLCKPVRIRSVCVPSAKESAAIVAVALGIVLDDDSHVTIFSVDTVVSVLIALHDIEIDNADLVVSQEQKTSGLSKALQNTTEASIPAAVVSELVSSIVLSFWLRLSIRSVASAPTSCRSIAAVCSRASSSLQQAGYLRQSNALTFLANSVLFGPALSSKQPQPTFVPDNATECAVQLLCFCAAVGDSTSGMEICDWLGDTTASSGNTPFNAVDNVVALSVATIKAASALSVAKSKAQRAQWNNISGLLACLHSIGTAEQEVACCFVHSCRCGNEADTAIVDLVNVYSLLADSLDFKLLDSSSVVDDQTPSQPHDWFASAAGTVSVFASTSEVAAVSATLKQDLLSSIQRRYAAALAAHDACSLSRLDAWEARSVLLRLDSIAGSQVRREATQRHGSSFGPLGRAIVELLPALHMCQDSRVLSDSFFALACYGPSFVSSSVVDISMRGGGAIAPRWFAVCVPPSVCGDSVILQIKQKFHGAVVHGPDTPVGMASPATSDEDAAPHASPPNTLSFTQPVGALAWLGSGSILGAAQGTRIFRCGPGYLASLSQAAEASYEQDHIHIFPALPIHNPVSGALAGLEGWFSRESTWVLPHQDAATDQAVRRVDFPVSAGGPSLLREKFSILRHEPDSLVTDPDCSITRFSLSLSRDASPPLWLSRCIPALSVEYSEDCFADACIQWAESTHSRITATLEWFHGLTVTGEEHLSASHISAHAEDTSSLLDAGVAFDDGPSIGHERAATTVSTAATAVRKALLTSPSFRMGRQDASRGRGALSLSGVTENEDEDFGTTFLSDASSVVSAGATLSGKPQQLTSRLTRQPTIRQLAATMSPVDSMDVTARSDKPTARSQTGTSVLAGGVRFREDTASGAASLLSASKPAPPLTRSGEASDPFRNSRRSVVRSRADVAGPGVRDYKPVLDMNSIASLNAISASMGRTGIRRPRSLEPVLLEHLSRLPVNITCVASRHVAGQVLYACVNDALSPTLSYVSGLRTARLLLQDYAELKVTWCEKIVTEKRREWIREEQALVARGVDISGRIMPDFASLVNRTPSAEVTQLEHATQQLIQLTVHAIEGFKQVSPTPATAWVLDDTVNSISVGLEMLVHT